MKDKNYNLINIDWDNIIIVTERNEPPVLPPRERADGCRAPQEQEPTKTI